MGKLGILNPHPKISRKFGRYVVDAPAQLAFPTRHAHPRIRAQLFQIGKGGCALATNETLFIGEECLVWCLIGGHKYLGAAGKVVWARKENDSHDSPTIVGIEFKYPIQLNDELLEHLGGSKTNQVPAKKAA